MPQAWRYAILLLGLALPMLFSVTAPRVAAHSIGMDRCQAMPSRQGGNGEIRNVNNQAVPAAGLFYDTAIRTGSDAGADHFDDLMSFPSIAELLSKTGLEARTH